MSWTLTTRKKKEIPLGSTNLDRVRVEVGRSFWIDVFGLTEKASQSCCSSSRWESEGQCAFLCCDGALSQLVTVRLALGLTNTVLTVIAFITVLSVRMDVICDEGLLFFKMLLALLGKSFPGDGCHLWRKELFLWWRVSFVMEGSCFLICCWHYWERAYIVMDVICERGLLFFKMLALLRKSFPD